jgi:hypothetical protein
VALWARWEGQEWKRLDLQPGLAFALDRLPDGPVRLRAHTLDATLFDEDAAEHVVAAGRTDVVVPLDSGLELDVEVVGMRWRRDVADRLANAYLKRHGEPMDWKRPSGYLWGDGRARFRGLRADRTYDLWIPQVDGDGCAHAKGLRAGRGLVQVAKVARESVRGRVLQVPPTKRGAMVFGECDGWDAVSVVLADDSFDLGNLPPGRWTLRAQASGRGSRGVEAWESPRTEVPSGSSGVVLRLERLEPKR